MTACRADRRTGRKIAFALAMAIIVPAAADAATGGPLSLQPGGQDESVSPAPIVPPREDFPGVTPPSAKVRVQELGALDNNAVGLLDESHGGFGIQMWAGTPLAVLQRVIPDLPAAAPSRAMHNLMRRLLLTAANVPVGKPGGPSLVSLRAERLSAMGETDSLVQFVRGVPQAATTPEMKRLAVDAALLSGDSQNACADLAGLRGSGNADAFVTKLQVYCSLAAGKTQEAGLGLDLLREQKVSAPLFFAAADTASGIGSGKVGDVWASAAPIDLGMVRLSKLAVPELAAQQIARPAAWRAIAQAPGASVEAKLVALEREAAYGLTDADTVRQAYEAVTFTPQELAAPVADKSPKGRALLYRATVQQNSPVAKAELIGKALNAAGENYPLAARVYAVELAALKPQPDLVAFAPMAARALFAAGRTEAANAWVQFARAQVLSGGEAANPVAALLVLQKLAMPEPEQSVAAGLIASWRQAAPADLSAEAKERRQAVGLGLLAAFGIKVPAEEWMALYDMPVKQPSAAGKPALWHGLRIAAEDLRLGETVLMALLTLGDGGLAHADPVDIYRAVSALRLIGLDADARSLAVEAAIANGV